MAAILTCPQCIKKFFVDSSDLFTPIYIYIYPYTSGLLHWPWDNLMIVLGQLYDFPSTSEVTLKYTSEIDSKQ